MTPYHLIEICVIFLMVEQHSIIYSTSPSENLDYSCFALLNNERSIFVHLPLSICVFIPLEWTYRTRMAACQFWCIPKYCLPEWLPCLLFPLAI